MTNKIITWSGILFLLTIASCTKKDVPQTPASTKITYDGHVKKIMNGYCYTCHSGSSASAGLRLETYDQVRNAITNKGLLDRINNDNAPMPPSGLMPIEDREEISQWSKLNFPKD